MSLSHILAIDDDEVVRQRFIGTVATNIISSSPDSNPLVMDMPFAVAIRHVGIDPRTYRRLESQCGFNFTTTVRQMYRDGILHRVLRVIHYASNTPPAPISLSDILSTNDDNAVQQRFVDAVHTIAFPGTPDSETLVMNMTFSNAAQHITDVTSEVYHRAVSAYYIRPHATVAQVCARRGVLNAVLRSLLTPTRDEQIRVQMPNTDTSQTTLAGILSTSDEPSIRQRFIDAVTARLRDLHALAAIPQVMLIPFRACMSYIGLTESDAFRAAMRLYNIADTDTCAQVCDRECLRDVFEYLQAGLAPRHAQGTPHPAFSASVHQIGIDTTSVDADPIPRTPNIFTQIRDALTPTQTVIMSANPSAIIARILMADNDHSLLQRFVDAIHANVLTSIPDALSSRYVMNMWFSTAVLHLHISPSSEVYNRAAIRYDINGTTTVRGICSRGNLRAVLQHLLPPPPPPPPTPTENRIRCRRCDISIRNTCIDINNHIMTRHAALHVCPICDELHASPFQHLQTHCPTNDLILGHLRGYLNAPIVPRAPVRERASDTMAPPPTPDATPSVTVASPPPLDSSQVDENPPGIQCQWCDERMANSLSTIWNHITTQHHRRHQLSPIQCPICNAAMAGDAATHITANHARLPDGEMLALLRRCLERPSVYAPEPIDERTVPCLVCSTQVGNTQEIIFMHLQAMPHRRSLYGNDTGYVCQICERTVVPDILLNHLIDDHTLSPSDVLIELRKYLGEGGAVARLSEVNSPMGDDDDDEAPVRERASDTMAPPPTPDATPSVTVASPPPLDSSQVDENPPGIQCPWCDERMVNSLSTIWNHITTQHHQLSPIQCPICNAAMAGDAATHIRRCLERPSVYAPEPIGLRCYVCNCDVDDELVAAHLISSGHRDRLHGAYVCQVAGCGVTIINISNHLVSDHNMSLVDAQRHLIMYLNDAEQELIEEVTIACSICLTRVANDPVAISLHLRGPQHQLHLYGDDTGYICQVENCGRTVDHIRAHLIDDHGFERADCLTLLQQYLGENGAVERLSEVNSLMGDDDDTNTSTLECLFCRVTGIEDSISGLTAHFNSSGHHDRFTCECNPQLFYHGLAGHLRLYHAYASESERHQLLRSYLSTGNDRCRAVAANSVVIPMSNEQYKQNTKFYTVHTHNGTLQSYCSICDTQVKHSLHALYDHIYYSDHKHKMTDSDLTSPYADCEQCDVRWDDRRGDLRHHLFEDHDIPFETLYDLFEAQLARRPTEVRRPLKQSVKHDPAVHAENDVCSICYEYLPNVLFIPCAHQVTCSGCVNKMSPEKRPTTLKCPICQHRVKSAYSALLNLK